MAEFLIIGGYSGAGRSEAAKCLDDLGWFVIDNLPTQLISKVAELAVAKGSATTHIALVVGAETPKETMQEIELLAKGPGINVRTVFLTANAGTLITRYEETRRRHPFKEGDGLGEKIKAEIVHLKELRGFADVELDTSDLNVHNLSTRLSELFTIESKAEDLQSRIVSFGFKHGVPKDVDLLLDCRFLPNPHWEDELRAMTGEDTPVREFLLQKEITNQFLAQLESMLRLIMPAYREEGKSYLSLAIGCTGGRHRSVMIVNELQGVFAKLGFEASVTHRDIEK
ncbi:MAG: RNase adapter RapZ [Acidimicrobiaceae bacterium]|jgi:UPF0042 nucleotide-binding protein|nr:RNase adapter RapZ [Acidimicrobiaceae bacterium]|tara:strand:- start:63651 stop:64502 length:852 start_codon:yes stop_codon:yes gene_type:complete